VADDLEADPPGRPARHRHGRHPRAVAGDRRDAPLILVGAAAFQRFNPELDGPFSALPIQILNAVGEPEAIYKNIAAATILVLLAILLLMNSVAIYLRNRYETKW
jgi:phosphate transport system permease protein